MYPRIKKTVSYFFARRSITDMEAYASHAAFYAMVSAVPLSMLAVMIFKSLAISEAEEIFLFIKSGLPSGLKEYFPMDLAENAVSSSIPLVSLTVLAMLWSSSKGIKALSDGIRSVYGVFERKGYFARRLSALAWTLALLVLFVLALVLLVFGSTILELLRNLGTSSGKILWLAVHLAPFGAFVLFFAVFSLLYKAICSDQRGIAVHFPGAVFASGGWILYSSALSFYLTNFMPRKYLLYGSMGALILLMLWVRSLMTILLFGAEINVYLQNCPKAASKKKG